MKKRVLSVILSAVLLTGCGISATESGQEVPNQEASEVDTQNSSDASDTSQETADTSDSEKSDAGDAAKKSLLGEEETIYYNPDIVPSVPDYTVEKDLSNVVLNQNQRYTFFPDYESIYFDAAKVRDLISKNGFVVVKRNYDEFFDIYESNRYNQTPSFITVDSLMHTYHLYFSYLMKNCEKSYLSEEIKTLSRQMLSESEAQCEELKDTDWYNAAVSNMAFFYIGCKLLGVDVDMPVALEADKETINHEYDKIMAAEGIDECAISNMLEDYSQYKPRGYYEGDEQLEQYFRGMMWYGRISYKLDTEAFARSAALQTLAISKNVDKWESIYNITSFFAGKSDDPGYMELIDLMKTAYGKLPDTSDLKDEAAFNTLFESMQKLDPPQVNSIPVLEGNDPIILSYRFMGQRFTIDAAIMQRLVYSAVEENKDGDRRYLPDTLDTAAALGSKKAFEILSENGATEYKNYTDNLTIVSDKFNNSDASLWNASLYAGWLNTLRPLFETRGKGYPSYMQSDEWQKKNLEAFAGSYCELKHDTILYAKQVMAEMGGGDEEEMDDRGYVDPEPVVYSRLKFLSEKTKEGLESYGMISDSAKEDMDKLTEIAGTLLTISEKELVNESLSDDDYEFIRCYGGYIEHFWREVNQEKYEGDLVYSYQAPCPIVADIATDPNGTVLEVGTGGADAVYVVFPIDGELHIASGSVYSFYQFETDISNRYTDSMWQQMLSGGYLDEDYNWVEVENKVEQPEWTSSYRVGY